MVLTIEHPLLRADLREVPLELLLARLARLLALGRVAGAAQRGHPHRRRRPGQWLYRLSVEEKNTFRY